MEQAHRLFETNVPGVEAVRDDLTLGALLVVRVIGGVPFSLK
jgi:hypothetical protein